MRRLLMTCVAIAALSLAGSSSATAETLPSAACNDGTMNAHESVPETTGTGEMTPAHAHIPMASGTSCSH
jgi:hypothetical protein